MKKFTVKEDCNLKDFTDCTYPQGSFAFAALIRRKDIKINGARAHAGARLKRGDEVVYYTTPAEEAKASHEIVFEDENILVADKYSGVSTEGLCEELKVKGCAAVHRLDRNTSGLIVFAKTAEAERELLHAFKTRGAHKIYHAVCKNCFENREGTLEDYIIKDEKNSLVKVVRAPRGGESGGKDKKPPRGALKIRTKYRVLRADGELALVEIELLTGRTHQIRAHMAFIGCPVLGDMKYGDKAFNAKYSAARQRLVSKRLSFSFSEDSALRYLNGIEFESNFNPTAI